jgi:hypothetical protein
MGPFHFQKKFYFKVKKKIHQMGFWEIFI